MKTKQIAPFKMKCENKSEFREVTRILENNGIEFVAGILSSDRIVNVFNGKYMTFTDEFDWSEPELTYSEFMKMYGEEKEDTLRFIVDYSIDCGIRNEECKNWMTNSTDCYGCVKARYKLIKRTND